MSLPVTIDNIHVVDTNALYWYLTRNRKLSKAAKAIFEAAQQRETVLVVSVIVLAELYWINKKLNGLDFAATYADLKARPYFQIVDYQTEDVLDLDKNPDLEMHDRMIVGLARKLTAPLITSDGLITASGLVTVLW